MKRNYKSSVRAHGKETARARLLDKPADVLLPGPRRMRLWEAAQAQPNTVAMTELLERALLDYIL